MITMAVINEELAMEASWDRIIVLEDEFKSGMECTTCAGKGHVGMKCPECHGNKKFRGKVTTDDVCTTCTIAKGTPLQYTLGYEPCPTCDGKKTSSLIIPEDSQSRPSTGVIQSVGPLCGYLLRSGEWHKIPEEAQLKVGQRVLYTNHTGNIFELGASTNKKKIRYLKESEVLGRMHGINKQSIEQGEFKDLREAGVL